MAGSCSDPNRGEAEALTGFGLTSPCDGAKGGCVARFDGALSRSVSGTDDPLLPPIDGTGDTDGLNIFPKKADARFEAFCVAELKSFGRPPGVRDETLDPLARPGFEGDTLEGTGEAVTWRLSLILILFTTTSK